VLIIGLSSLFLTADKKLIDTVRRSGLDTPKIISPKIVSNVGTMINKSFNFPERRYFLLD
jgi:hypothetical protein